MSQSGRSPSLVVRSPQLNERTVAMRGAFLDSVAAMVGSVRVDIRDEWSTDTVNDYARGDILSRGTFGMVFAAQGRDFTNGFVQSQPRPCVLKLIYLGQKMESIAEANADQEAFLDKAYKFLEKLLVELYILNRCRHENIMHAHAVAVQGGDLHIVLPRFYSLEELIVRYRQRHNDESLPVRVIMMVVRQLCSALSYLHAAGIVHRVVQPEYVFVTRGGTVKLGHFGNARLVKEGASSRECVSPVGKFAFMSFEKQYNMMVAERRSQSRTYDAAADVWSLGVIVLRMVSFFPDEKCQRLDPGFPLVMHHENMPFTWIVAEMMQLRVRLAKCGGGEDLKAWLSEYVLTRDPRKRATAAQLLSTGPVLRLCHEHIEDDQKYLTKHLVLALDWPNRAKLETTRPNYDALESKDIPAAFYWDEHDSWKCLESASFAFSLRIGSGVELLDSFSFASVESLFSTLCGWVKDGLLMVVDVLSLDHAIRQACFSALDKFLNGNAPFAHELEVALPRFFDVPERAATVCVRLLDTRQHHV